MSVLEVAPASRSPGSAATAPALDESLWRDWVATGRARERRNDAKRSKALTWLAIAGLIAGAAAWSLLAPYDLVVRFIVATAAVVGVVQATQAKRYVLAAVFAMLALLYNPIAPAFSFSGEWQRMLVAASVLPFAASLGWRKQQGGTP